MKNFKNQGKILVADDEKFNQNIIFGFLMILGIHNRKELCEFAENGEDAFEKIRNSVQNNNPHKYSLILMDCNMPIMDGYESTRRIRRLFNQMDINLESQPKIIAITGHVENEYIDKAIDSGMNKVFSKPLNIKEFGKLMVEMKYIT